MTLDELGIKHQTDKASNHHNYLIHYEKIFNTAGLSPENVWVKNFGRSELFNILEIGFGGYQYPDRGGQSIDMWLEYFPYANIRCLEFYSKDRDKYFHPRLELIQGSQTDKYLLKRIADKYYPLIVIDDGSHKCPDIIFTFTHLFPHLPSGAIYIIEDTESSYWDEIATDGTDFGGGNHPNTTMNYFKALTDTINGEYSRDCKRDDQIVFVDMITSISFYKGFICIIKK